MSIPQSQWQEINQPSIGTVSIIMADGNELFTATNQAQVFTSINQADSWEILADTMNTQPYGVDLLFKKGDAVSIEECRPYSKNKRWIVSKNSEETKEKKIGNKV